ncbi:class I SAM-dependent methyltransferase [Asticcacaulis machinosus]|uniref:Class I SAM-dependent methyltransferase n=1 Tax=Asticcacaulis machinosus TaxID=2984211 RepID=A0ABT5HJV8_9CAUL|nr:class I SAM-dependent methyltransferase [Asticcacaulis machinosus]MDC7676503.1 class I SAM-dependent methyltransferase [Asticcacaulis machinosus]
MTKHHDMDYLHHVTGHFGLARLAGDGSHITAFASVGGIFTPVIIDARLELNCGTYTNPTLDPGSAPALTHILFLPARDLPELQRLVTMHIETHRPENVALIGTYQSPDAHLNLYGDERTVLQDHIIDLGYARHPADCAQLSDYNRLDCGPLFVAILRARSEASLQQWPVSEVRKERDLHMDMLLEGNRRADAHTIRYVFASCFVSTGDKVVDAACGMGYGVEIIRTLSDPENITGVDISDFSYRIGSALHLIHPNDRIVCSGAEQMPFIENESIDVVASFETIEHVIDCDTLLREFHRILRPGGKLVASVPNVWVDESGKDPNPDHHHIFYWQSFYNLIERTGFSVESAWSQNAGGALKEPFRLRQFGEVRVTAPPETSEWCVVCAIRK